MSIGLASSCVVVSPRHDNGNHNGWTKNTNNPHHPATTNPGHTKSVKSNGNAGNGNSNSKKPKK
jgi:hypothetical protein